MENKGKWFLAGTLMGAAGLGLMQSMKGNGSRKSMKKMRNSAANMATRISHEAGEALSNAGSTLAEKIR